MKILGYFLDNIMLTQNSQWKTTDSEAEETLPNKPGFVHKVPGMDTLEAIRTPELSPNWLNAITMLQGIMPDISGVRQVNYGATSSGVTAASAIVALQEAGKTIKELKEDGISQAVARWAKMAIQLMKLYTTWHWGELVGATPNPTEMDTPFDVSILYSEALPSDKNMRINISKVMTDSQIIDPIGFAKVIGDPTLTSIIEESQKRIAEMQQKQQEQQALATPRPTPSGGGESNPLGELGAM
jgi:hypothetical protein